MQIMEAFPSKYLKAADCQKPMLLTMGTVVTEDIGGDHRPVLYFQGKEQGLVLNKTNSTTISEIYGWETDDWDGKPIVLFAATTDFQGKRVPCIRCRAPKSGAVPPPSTPAQRAAVVMDDEVPF